MAQQLWLLRHGEAEPHDARSDFDRELTDRGRDQSRAAGRALAALALEFHAGLHEPEGPRPRHRAAGLRGARRRGRSSTSRSRRASTRARRSRSSPPPVPTQRVLVVGHEPDFSARSSTTSPAARVDFKKGGVAGVRLDGAAGELIVLLRPREIDRIA